MILKLYTLQLLERLYFYRIWGYLVYTYIWKDCLQYISQTALSLILINIITPHLATILPCCLLWSFCQCYYKLYGIWYLTTYLYFLVPYSIYYGSDRSDTICTLLLATEVKQRELLHSRHQGPSGHTPVSHPGSSALCLLLLRPIKAKSPQFSHWGEMC